MKNIINLLFLIQILIFVSHIDCLSLTNEKYASCLSKSMYPPQSNQFNQNISSFVNEGSAIMINDKRIELKKLNLNETFLSAEAVLTNILFKIDHIYIICLKNCKTKIVPSKWRNKVSMVDGKKSDECLGLSDKSHWDKVTASHKICVVDGITKKYNRIAILEGDFSFYGKPDWSIKTYKEMEKSFLTQNKIMYRFGYYATPQILDKQYNSRCNTGCLCTSVTSTLCNLPGKCYLHSSTGYVISSNDYDKFIKVGGAIDGSVLAAFNQTLFIPSLVRQRGYGEDTGEKKFIKYCKSRMTPHRIGSSDQWHSRFEIPI